MCWLPYYYVEKKNRTSIQSIIIQLKYTFYEEYIQIFRASEHNKI